MTLIQPTPFIATDARDLRWKHGIVLSGADYIHVASALAVKCLEFITTDNKILQSASKLKQLGTRPCTAAKTALLPDRYRQEGMFDGKVTVGKRPTGKGGKA